MSIHFGTPNTNCLTHIPNDINLSLDPLNVTVVGSPTVSNGVVSGFSSANYLTIPKRFPANATNFEFVFKFKSSSFSSFQYWFNTAPHYSLLLGTSSSGKIILYASSNTTSWDIINGIEGVTKLNTNTWYYVKCTYDGQTYKAYISTDNVNWNSEITISSTKIVGVNYDVCWIGNGWIDQSGVNTTIDLSQSYIKINGSTWWQGGTGNLTVKKGSKVYVPNGWTDYKYYKYTYENWTQPIATAATTAIDGGDMVITATNQYSSSYPWRAMDGNITNSAWVMNETTKGYWQLKLPYKIVITGLTFYNTQGKNRSNTGRFYTSSAKTTPIGNEFTATNSDFATTVISGIPSTGIETDTIYLDLTSSTGSSSGMGELKITAKRKTGSVESTSSDYDYKVGTGTMIFDEVVIDKDHTTTDIYNRKIALFFNASGLQTWAFSECYSGGTAPTGGDFYKKWYDTTSNVIKTTDNGGNTWYAENNSLPLAIATSNTSGITSIDQTFNGFGYIGSTAFALPGVKGLIPNGFNDDGTYKSIELDNRIRLRNLGGTNTYTVFMGQSGDFDYVETSNVITSTSTPSSGRRWYNPSTNLWTNIQNSTVVKIVPLGEVVLSSGKITSLTINPVQPEKTGRKIKKVYFGTQNTNCLTYIPEDVKLTLDPLNVKITGSPTVSSGVVSGFSSANYLTLPDIFTPGTKSWEYVIKIKFSSVSGIEYFFGSKNYVMPLIGRVGNRFKIWISTNGSSWNFASEKSGTYTVLVDTYYWIKMKFTGSAYILSYSTDGSTFTDDINVSGTATIKGGSAPVIGYGWTDNPLTTGTVDLTACYIKIGGTTTWKGGTGKLTLKKGSKVYVPNGYTSYKYYKYTYENWTQPTLSANGTMGGSSFAVAQSSSHNGVDFYKAISGVDNWHATAGFPQWVSWYNPNPLKVTKLSFGGMSVGNITQGIVQGSNDNLNWINLVEFNNTILTTAWEIDLSSNKNAYKYYRIYITNASYYSKAYYALIDKYFTITAQAQTGSVESTSSDYDYKVGSGSMIFDEIITTKDLSLIQKFDNQNMKVFVRSDLSELCTTTGDSSGATTPTASTSYIAFYNTSENKCYFDIGSWIETSLPIAIVDRSADVGFTSIDQVFNGFGYIGSTVFTLPGFKGLMSKGFNPDGTYKSIEFESKKVAIKVLDYNPGADKLFIYSNGNLDEGYYFSQSANPNTNYSFWHDTSTNIYKRRTTGDYAETEALYIGNFTDDNVSPSKITSLTPNQVQPEKTGREITRIYKGSTLVYGYGVNEVLFESSTAGTATVNIEYDGYYELTVIGGGSGGAFEYSAKFADGAAGGGSGAGLIGVAYLSAGLYSITVGAGGAGAWDNNSREWISASAGGASSFGSIVTAGGGTAATARYNGGSQTAGAGGTLSYTSSAFRSTSLAKNGNAGATNNNASTSTAYAGGAAVYGSYGAGGKAQYGGAYAGGNGYVKVVAI